MENKKPSLFSQIRPYLKGFQLPLALAFVGAVLSNIITVYGPNKLKEITNLISDGLATSIDLKAVSQIALLLTVLYAVGALLNYGQSFIISTVIQYFSKRLRTAIAEKINKLPLGYFDGHSQGDTLSRVTNDVDTVGQSLNQSLGNVISASLLLVAVVLTMFFMNWILALVTILATVLGFVFVGLIMGKSQGYFTAQQNNLAAVNGYVEEMYSGHNVVTSYNAIEQSKERFAVLNHNLYNSIWKSQFISGMMMPLMFFTGNFAYVLVILVGAALAINGSISIGIIVAFMVYVRTFSQPLSQIAQGITVLQQAGAALVRVLEFLAEPEMEDDQHKEQQLAAVKGDVAFEDVFFGYKPDQTIIHDFSAQAKAGQKIAIVGSTGAGKTTITNLINRFYEIQEGKIRYDGINISKIKKADLRASLGIVLQDTNLFTGTVMENIRFGRLDATDEECIEAAKLANADGFINRLPDGYQTMLRGNGANLSQGQRQLLAIARAAVMDPPALILDEATSSIDSRTEQLVQRGMDSLMKGRTTFVIAHRLSTIKNADCIMVMEQGRIIERGNHEELLEKKGRYYRLYTGKQA